MKLQARLGSARIGGLGAQHVNKALCNFASLVTSQMSHNTESGVCEQQQHFDGFLCYLIVVYRYLTMLDVCPTQLKRSF